jgi:hypothetical protein
MMLKLFTFAVIFLKIKGFNITELCIYGRMALSITESIPFLAVKLLQFI